MDFNKSLSPEELAEDFHTLRSILQSSPQFGNYLVGPDVTTVSNHSKTARFFERYMYSFVYFMSLNWLDSRIICGCTLIYLRL